MDICLVIKYIVNDLIDEKEILFVEFKNNEFGFPILFIKVSENDIKRVIGINGKNYRSFKTISRYLLNDESVDVIIDLAKK